MDELTLSLPEVRRILAVASGDAALLWLHLRAGGSASSASFALRLPEERVRDALSILVRLGLWNDGAPEPAVQREPPVYTEADVLRAAERDGSFALLLGEVQRRLGRILSTEELKILLSMTDYLGLPHEVVSMLVIFCIQRGRARGQSRLPSLRTIEKEAYHWHDKGIDTLETAGFYMQEQLDRQSAVGRVQERLGLTGRRLTQAEERYILSWLELGFGEDAIALAHERTCLNTGGMKWAYCNSILQSWHGKDLHTVPEIEAGDGKGAPRQRVPAGSAGQGELGAMERDALSRMLRDTNGSQGGN